jgi:hypothetical protein
MSFEEKGEFLGHTLINGKQVPRYRGKTIVKLYNTQTNKEYNSDKEGDDDVNDPNTATKREHLRRDVTIIAPMIDMVGGTVKTPDES